MEGSTEVVLSKWRRAWRSLDTTFNPAEASTTIKAVGGLGFLLMAVSTFYGLYDAVVPGLSNWMLELAAGYLLGFLVSALVHDLACAVKSEESELLRYVRLARGTKYEWLAWVVLFAAVIALGVLIYLQVTVEITRLTLYASLIGSVVASEFTMMYINKVQGGRESRRIANTQQLELK